MNLYKIQHKNTKQFNQKRLFYWSESSRWNDVGTFWTNISDITKYLSQFAKLTPYDTGVDISDWQIVEYTVIPTGSTPAINVIYEH